MNKHMAVDTPLDVAALREDFPILSTKVYGKPLVYLDSAASAQKPKQVVDRMVHATYHEYANVHRGLHYLANAATDAFEVPFETGKLDELPLHAPSARARIAPSARPERRTVLRRRNQIEQRRHDHLVAVRAEAVQQMASQLFDLAGFRRQHVGNILGK